MSSIYQSKPSDVAVLNYSIDSDYANFQDTVNSTNDLGDQQKQQFIKQYGDAVTAYKSSYDINTYQSTVKNINDAITAQQKGNDANLVSVAKQQTQQQDTPGILAQTVLAGDASSVLNNTSGDQGILSTRNPILTSKGRAIRGG